MIGMKYDKDKLNWTLLPFDCIESIVEVLDYGAKKYAPNNWKLLENPVERYTNALLRHLVAFINGEIVDKESGLTHLQHVGCNALFLIWFQKNGENKKDVL